MSLTCRVRIALNNMSAEKTGAVRGALEPDNTDFPEGLSLSIEDADGGLVFVFESEGGMGHLIGTVDEVLGHVQVALRVIG